MKLRNKIISVFLCLIIIAGIIASGGEGLSSAFDVLFLKANAETVSGTYGDNITWELNKDTGLLVFSGTGNIGSMDPVVGSSYVYPWCQEELSNNEIEPDYDGYYSVKEIVINEGVSGIGCYAFAAYCALESVYIPSTVTKIGELAFFRCISLFNITIAEHNPVYHSSGNCIIETASKKLIVGSKDCVIPDDGSVTSIGAGAFFGIRCSNLFIPSSITHIDNAFSIHYFDDQMNVTVSKDNPVFHSSGNCIIETASKTLVAALSNSVIPDDGSVTSLRPKVLMYTVLSGRKIRIPSSVSTLYIGYQESAYKSTYIFLPENADVYDSYDFYNCFPGNIFVYESSANSITQEFNNYYSEPILSIHNYNENGIINPLDSLTYTIDNEEVIITRCEKSVTGVLTIPSEIEGYPVTRICYNAFNMCYGISEINLPDTIKQIDSRAFAGCVCLRKINIPKNVESIGTLAFMDCTNLEVVNLSDENSFYHCAGNCIIENQTKKLVMGYYYPVIPDDGSVEIIDFGAFSSCLATYYLAIPKSVKSMGTGLFLKNNRSVRCVCYEGTSDEWNSIERFIPVGCCEDEPESELYYADAGYNYSRYFSNGYYYYGDSNNNEFTNLNNEYGRTFFLGDNPDHVHEYRHYGIKAPTCTKDGFELIACPYCGDRYNRVIPALGHDIIHCDYSSPTCGAPGHTAYDYCSRRDYSTYVEIPATGSHSMKYTAQGNTITVSCEKCDEMYSATAVLPDDMICSDVPKVITVTGNLPDEYITNISYETEDGLPPKKAGVYTAYFDLLRNDLSDVILARVTIKMTVSHKLTPHDGKAPTCTQTGWEPYNTCDNCEYTSYKSIPELGHNYSVSYQWADDGSSCHGTAICSNDGSHTIDEDAEISSNILSEPTCEQMGITCYTATFNDTVFKTQTNELMDIPENGHNYVPEVTDPTCTKGGYTTYTCHCGRSYIDDYTDALGHNYQPVTTVLATCTQNGQETSKCSRCGDEHTVIIYATGHHYSQYVTAPTCTKQGFTTYICDCGYSYKTSYVAALGHSFVNYVYNEDATTEQDGTETAKCERCDETDTRVKPGTKIHVHAYYETVTPPTCTNQGYTTYTCECGDTYNSAYVASLGHSFTNYVYNNDATADKDGTETAKCDRCDVTSTRTKPGTKLTPEAPDTSKTVISAPSGNRDINWRYRAHLVASAVNLPTGYHLAWFENNSNICDKADFTTGSLTSDKTYTVMIVDKTGKPVGADDKNVTVTLKVKNDFITKIISFFSRLFGGDVTEII